MGDTAKFGLQSYYGLIVGIAFVSVWGFLFLLLYTNPNLPSRPGPQIPDNEFWLSYSYKSLYETLSKAAKLPQLFKFLLAWFGTSI